MSPVPISKTKIIIPHRRPELLSRDRLLEGLNAFLDRKLVLLSAPAGYGKTSLLVDLAHRSDLPVCWLSLDPLDRDPQRFLAYLIAALTERFKGLSAPLIPQLNNLKSIEDDAEALLVSLTNELYEQVEEDFLLILDDYHLLDNLPVIAALVNRFLQLVDENCHVILSSRTLPSLPDITLMVAREQINGLGQTDLAFQPVEIQALYHQNQRRDISEPDARRLSEQTGGWVTGLLLSDLSGGANVSRVDTFSYLGRQVLDQQPPATRDFLLRTSLPEEFNAELCEAILGPTPHESWPSLMGEVLDKNLFVLPVGDGRWLRYHPLFREFLQARLREEYPSKISPTFERLTQFYEKSGEWEKAYDACRQLDNPEKLAGVVERGGTPMLQHALTTLENWVNSLPPSLLRSRPGLVSLRGAIALKKREMSVATDLLEEAVHTYRQAMDLDGLTLALVRRAHMHRLASNHAAALADAEEALQLTEPHPHLQAIFAEALRQKGGNLLRLGNLREAAAHIERSLALYTALNESGSITSLLSELGGVNGLLGDIETARNFHQRALDIWQAEKNLAAQAGTWNELGFLYHQSGEYELAADTYEQGLSLAGKAHNTRAEAVILIGLGDLYAEVGEFASAEQAYERARPAAEQWRDTFIDIYLSLARITLALLQGEAVRANALFREVQAKKYVVSNLPDQGLYSLAEGRLHLLMGQAAQAVSAFQASKELYLQNGRAPNVALSSIWLAAALGSDGQIEAARAEIRELLNKSTRPTHTMLVGLLQSRPWLKPVLNDVQVGRSLHGLLEKATRIEASWPGVRRSLRRLAQSIHMPTPSLVIRAFGRAEVQVDGRPVTVSDWSTVSVRDLFFYLLFKSGPVTKEQIAASLWPEVDEPQTLKQRFKAYIFRLRRATRRDAILFDEEYYRFNFSLDYEYDVEAFETYLARSRMLKTREERIEQLQKAVDLARGPYLSEVDQPWAIGERDRLEQAGLSALETLAGLYLENGQFQQAVETAQRALKIDAYLEALHCILMRAYAAQGDQNSVRRQYQACQTSLADLGFSPSPETRDLYKRLMG